MSVYVDDLRYPKSVGRINGVWSHLFADSRDELDAFAAALGLSRAWIQEPGTHREHYDLVESRRAKALQQGAIPISYIAGVAELMSERRKLCQCRTIRECTWGRLTAEPWRRPNPRRITVALDRAHLVGPSADAKLDAAEHDLDNWEAGRSAPSDAQLAKLARLANVPLDFFYLADHDHPQLSVAHVRVGGRRGCETVVTMHGEPAGSPQPSMFETNAMTDADARIQLRRTTVGQPEEQR